MGTSHCCTYTIRGYVHEADFESSYLVQGQTTAVENPDLQGGVMQPPVTVVVEYDGIELELTHHNTWCYVYHIDPYHNFVLVFSGDDCYRMFNNQRLHGKLLTLRHNVVSEYEPSEAIREAYESTIPFNTSEIIKGFTDLLEQP